MKKFPNYFMQLHIAFVLGLGIYIGALQWVEMPNTQGMSQFADGGIVGTKPYFSRSSRTLYLIRNYMNSVCNPAWFRRKNV